MPRRPASTSGAKTTREQILDVALELFNAAGYDKTSLREIAERMGFSKAALYYHFASKEDILMALHMRLHDLGNEGFDLLDSDRARPQAWPAFLDNVIDKMLDNRALFVLHAHNHAAFEKLHEMGGHQQENEDLVQRLRHLLTDTSVPMRQRVRLACSIGAIMSGLVLAGDVFSDVRTADMSQLLREAVADLLGPVVSEPAASRCSKPTSNLE